MRVEVRAAHLQPLLESHDTKDYRDAISENSRMKIRYENGSQEGFN